jgi:Holliday junction resolvase
MKKQFNVTKSSGETAKFSEEKLKNSLQRAGADSEEIDFILKEIASKLYEGITTKKIYRMAFMLLKDSSRHLAARYHLKQAIMELGPSGYPFEKFIGEILNAQGYKTQVGQILKGACVTHEVDVLAEKENSMFMIECKYHNLSNKINDVKIPLYIQSRFKDLEAIWLKSPSNQGKTYKGWVVTNTKFSTDAIQYGTCSGLNLVGWDYPAKGSLKDQIDTLGLYPITCLTSLTKLEKQSLLDRKIVLCKEIYNNEALLKQIMQKPARIYTAMKEAEQLCQFLFKNGTEKK